MSGKSDDWNGWKPLLTELEERKRQARSMGGPDRLERLVYARGKLDARQRLQHLFDPDSFNEIGALVGGHITMGSQTRKGDEVCACVC